MDRHPALHVFNDPGERVLEAPFRFDELHSEHETAVAETEPEPGAEVLGFGTGERPDGEQELGRDRKVALRAGLRPFCALRGDQRSATRVETR